MRQGFFLVAFIALVLLSNCKKKEENKPGNPDLNILVISKPGILSYGSGMVQQKNGDFTFLQLDIDLTTQIDEIKLVDIAIDENEPKIVAENLLFKSTSFRYSIAPTKNKGFISVIEQAKSPRTFHLLKGNSALEIVSSYSRPENSANIYKKAIELKDGYAVLSKYYNKIKVQKLDYSFTVIWEKVYGGEEVELPIDIVELSSGDIGVLSNTSSFGSGDFDFWYLKVSANDGDSLTSKTFGRDKTDLAQLMYSDNNVLYIVGDDISTGNSECLFLSIDETGNVIWEKNFGKKIRIKGISKTEKGYLVAGNIRKFNQYDLYIAEIDNMGNILWDKEYGDENLSENLVSCENRDEIFYLLVTRGTADGRVETLFVKDKFGN